ncbi:serine/threonine-protein phosphatase 1 regulatory subunit 10 [Plutella xylostella]|uniref:serine/threonine-protein phosphatase 1 regulatory subunit 10 n=1 Tax=Plutella xylostella TaxID=51655 RepID=UPI002032F230|nr:serine/threonine-protein phosphatase 1 regulatory subunit 10 [Plutella xylostella]
MPRIDPIQLLKCLSVLLSPTGGIKSKDELQRLAKLMTKFSKKLVSKCIYIQILKCTEMELLGVFMGSGGWRLVHMWLTESIVAKNWPLVRELLELLLLCPVDIERLKTNNCPKLVKELSKDGNHIAIRALATKLVEQWLKTVKGEVVDQINISDIPQIIADASSLVNVEAMNCMETEQSAEPQVKKEVLEYKATADEIKTEASLEKVEVKAELDESDIKIKEEASKEKETLPVLKISLKDGKQVISQVDENDVKSSIKTEKSKHKKEKSSEKSSSSSKSSSSKHSSKSHSSSEKHKSSSHRSSSSPSHHSKDRSKDKERRSSHSSSSKSSKHSDSSKKSSEKTSTSSSRSSKEEKSSRHSSDSSKDNKSKDKDDKNSKDTSITKTEKSDKPSIHKLGKIPKLSDSKKDKPSISIEVRKPDEPKPKTVKTFHSKFRSHGLEEEVKPPPSRASLLSKKVLPALPPTVSIPKRPSPVHNESPPEKKAKTVEPVEKPGAIKLIPAKPKPMLLLESDMFMDALNASATNKKEPKKRKRRTSGSKDGSGEASPPHTPASPTRDAKPPRFYQDTLDTDDDKDKSIEKENETNDNTENIDLEKKVTESMETTEPHTITVNGLKGVLCYHKKRGPKKSIKWKPEAELEEVQYFELDETERVNVTKTFTDMKNWERIHEREAFQKGRNLSNEDVMEEKTNWRPLIPIDTEGQVHVDYGKNSKEKDIQAMRQKGTLQPLYFHKSMIPDSALEPEPETHLYSEPSIIPLEDVTGNTDNISDFRNMPWPEPKGNAPPQSASTVNVAPMFQPNMAQFPNSFPNQFPGVPPFQAPTMVPNDWQNAVPPMMANGMAAGPMGAMPPGAMPPGAMPPGMMMPETMMMGPEMFGAPNAMFGPVPPEGFMMDNMMAPNMFPPDFNMSGGVVGGGGAEGFQGGSFRGNMRGRGAGGGGHWRGKGSWDGPPRGRGGHSRGGRKTVCIYFQRKGSCRQGDNCTFLHPGVNGPY